MFVAPQGDRTWLIYVLLITREVSMKELGIYLKRVRISNGVNMAEAAEDLDLTVAELENIESGNIKAFKDLYDLKEYIQAYSKYLGLNPEKIGDEFNNFFFDHTSKISLSDIKNAQKKDNDEVKNNKIKSPYTKEYKTKSFILPMYLIGVVVLIVISVIIYFVVNNNSKAPVMVDELSPIGGRESIYEFTN